MPAYKMGYEYKDPPKSIIFGASYQEKSLSYSSRIITTLFFLLTFTGYAQVNYEVSFHFYADSTRVRTILPDVFTKVDSIQLPNMVSQHLGKLYDLGHLAAQSRTIFHSEKKADVYYYANKAYQMAYLSQGSVSDEILNKIGFDTKNFKSKPFSYTKLSKLLNQILDYAENHGYPFASVKLDSIAITSGEISAWLNYQKGPMIVFDSMVVFGYDKVKVNYLMTHLGIYKGKPYEEKLISEIPKKVKLLSFISLTGPPEITISNGKCVINLDLTQQKVSMFDGILGVLPNQKNGNGVLITGQLKLDLMNVFSSGKRIALDWQSYNVGSQLLDALYYHPNIFRTPLNIQTDFNLLKQDSSFINRKFALELSLLSKNSNKIGFRTELVSSNLISTYGMDDLTELPDNTDYNLKYYGLNYQLNRFNDVNFPSKGWGVLLTGSIGQKKIIKNPSLNQDIYIGISLNTIQFRIDGEIEQFLKLYKNILLRSKIAGGYLNGENLFQSDAFRIGGLNSLRGFTENQFYTSAFGVGTMEIRAMFSQGTYFLLFFDQGVLSEFNDISSKTNYPFGTGAGFSFSTSAGIFNFILALGKSSSQPFGFNYSKIHFGYISRF